MPDELIYFLLDIYLNFLYNITTLKKYGEKIMKKELPFWLNTPYPEMIRSLPEIDVPLKGIRGWLLQGQDQQLVFFDLQTIAEIPEHFHGEQWGVLISGEMELTIKGETQIYYPGEWYYIPANAPHSAKFIKRCFAIDFFADKNRYKSK